MNKFVKGALIIFLAVTLLAGAFSGGFITGRFTTSDSHQALFAPFWQSWDLVHEKYVDQPIDDSKLMQGAIRGMMASLGDSHTTYMDPTQFKQQNTQLSGEYEGIGAFVDATGDYLAIVSPMKDSPAEKAGLKPGDIILKIDGENMTGIPGDLVIQKVLGPHGTNVVLTILRKDQDPFDVTVTRAKIVVPSVEGKMLDNDIAYVQLFTFGETTDKELRTTLRELSTHNPKGLILDLRYNGGGYLDTAIQVVSEFVDEGVVVYEKSSDGKELEHDVIPGGQTTKIPMVVLINEGSASASEITAGALQDSGRAKLVGVTSYGKGSVQSWIALSNEQGAVAITIAKWLTPSKRIIDHVGLTPDVVVKMTQADFDAHKDPQLDAAIQTLLEMNK